VADVVVAGDGKQCEGVWERDGMGRKRGKEVMVVHACRRRGKEGGGDWW
jgi:hypothetical protein